MGGLSRPVRIHSQPGLLREDRRHLPMCMQPGLLGLRLHIGHNVFNRQLVALVGSRYLSNTEDGPLWRTGPPLEPLLRVWWFRFEFPSGRPHIVGPSDVTMVQHDELDGRVASTTLRPCHGCSAGRIRSLRWSAVQRQPFGRTLLLRRRPEPLATT